MTDTTAGTSPAATDPASASTDATDRTALREQAEATLRALAGDAAVLRADQWTAIEALVADRRRALVVQRTGWGKSAVYFVATALLRARGAGPTVIVSPLLALMRNQIAAAARAGIHAVTVNSTNLEDWQQVYADVAAGQVDVLLVSPERLNNPEFRDAVLPHLAATCGLLVVDEAHCISDWGHDFRPDFRRLRTLLPDLPPGTPVLATTATANQRVVDDVSDALGLRGAQEGGDSPVDADVVVLRGSLERDSLRLGVLSLPTAAHRLAWLTQHLDELPGSGIVYTLTVAAAQEIADHLRAAGHTVAAYTGQTDPADRLAAEDDLVHNRVKALVATSALGMGFDKPDLGFVVHVGAPASPIAYYQQVGRAGRGVDDAVVLLLPGPEDEAIWRYFASLGFPPAEQVRTTLDALAGADGPLSTPALETRVELGRSRLEVMLKVLDVDGAVRRVRGGWTATGAEWHYDTERYARVARTRADEQQAMRDYLATDRCRMRFLREQLDDPHAADCGRCDNCAGPVVTDTVDDADVRAAGSRLDRPGVTIDPRRRWPTAMPSLGIELRGSVPAGEQAEAGRALARLTDPGLGARMRAVLSDQTDDAAVPTDVIDAAVRTLKSWDWAERPTAVAWIGSHRRPRLIEDLASHLAGLGRLDLLGGIEHRGPSALRRSNSAHRLAEVVDAYNLPAPVAQRIGETAPVVLLVDDLVDTGWTMTVAAATLRRAGARAVLPLVVGVNI